MPGKYCESVSYMLLGINVYIKNWQKLLLHRNLRIWHTYEKFLNILLDYYLKISCTISVTIEITLSYFTGYFDYQISVMLSSETGTKSGSKCSETSGWCGEFPDKPSLSQRVLFSECICKYVYFLTIEIEGVICKFFME